MPEIKETEQYLALAEEAELQASTSLGKHVRESWMRIAMSYREMAGAGLPDVIPDAVSEQPSEADPEGVSSGTTRTERVWRRMRSWRLFSAVFSWAPTNFGSR